MTSTKRGSLLGVCPECQQQDIEVLALTGEELDQRADDPNDESPFNENTNYKLAMHDNQDGHHCEGSNTTPEATYSA